MFLSRNKKNNIYPCKPQFYFIKVGLGGSKLYKVCFRDVNSIVDVQKEARDCMSFGRNFLYKKVLDALV